MGISFIVNNRILFILLLLCVFTISWSQHSVEFDKIYKQFPDAPAVRINEETTTKIMLKDGKIYIEQEVFEKDIYLENNAIHASKREISYSTFFRLLNIEASSYNLVNGKYRKTEVDGFNKRNELDEIFYDDAKVVSFIFPKLTKGSKSELRYIKEIKNPRFLNKLYFKNYIPTIKNKVKIIVDNGININFKYFNMEGLNVKHSREEKKQKTIYTWETENVDEVKHEKNIPSINNVLPHIIPIITSYTYDGKKINLADDVKDLYSWYYSLIENVNAQKPSEELVKLVQDITSDKEKPLQKIKAIFFWVQKNIKYIANGYALGGFIPREANDIYYKRYGDCKDNTSLMQEMLEIAGISSYITWIGTREIPYTYNELPTPAIDNHMILSYDDEDGSLFFDATGRYVPFGFPTPFIQGKEALISYDKDSFQIKKIPIVKPFLNQIVDSAQLHLVNDMIVGKSIISYSGFQKMDIFNEIDDIKNEQKKLEFYNERIRKGNNKFLITKLNERNKYDYVNDFELQVSFEIKDYARVFENDIYLNLNLNNYASRFRTDINREHALAFDYKQLAIFKTRFEIPKGYKVEYLPETFFLENELLKATISYNHQGNFINYSHSVETNFLELDKEQQLTVNQLIGSIENAYKEVITLKLIPNEN